MICDHCDEPVGEFSARHCKRSRHCEGNFHKECLTSHSCKQAQEKADQRRADELGIDEDKDYDEEEKPLSKRKPHNQEAGYVASRKNALTGKANVIYIAAEQKIDTGGMKYAIVCDAHALFTCAHRLPAAREDMKDASQWCDGCKVLANKG